MKRFMLPLDMLNTLFVMAVIFGSLAFTSVCLKGDGELRKQFKIPKIIGEKQADACLMPKYMMNAWYHIEIVRPFWDSLKLENKKEKKDYYEFYEDYTAGEKDKFSNDGLVVIADTVNELAMLKKPIWASYLFHSAFNNSRRILQDDTLIQEVKSFPIYIANLSNTQTANLRTQDGSVIMRLQAQDEKHKWRDIEYWSNSWCGNSYFSLNIPPQHFAFTRGIKCSGDYNTLCRLKVYNRSDSLFSNTFRMDISKTQFEKPVFEGE